MTSINNKTTTIKTKCSALTKKGCRCKRNAVSGNFGVCNQHKDYFTEEHNKYNLFDKNLIDSDDFRGFHALILSVDDKQIKEKWENATQYSTEEHATALKEDMGAFFEKFDNHITELKKTDEFIIHNSIYKDIRQNAENDYFQCQLYKRLIFNINTMTGDKFEVRINSRTTRTYRDLKREIIKQCFHDDRLNINIALFLENEEEEFSTEKLQGGNYHNLQFHHYEALCNNAVFCLPSVDKRPDTKEGGIFKVGDKVVFRMSGYSNFHGIVCVNEDKPNPNPEIYGEMVYIAVCPTENLTNSDRAVWSKKVCDGVYIQTTKIKRCDRWDKTDLFNAFFKGEWVDRHELYEASYNHAIEL